LVPLPGGADIGPRADVRGRRGANATDANGDRCIPREESRATVDPARLHGERTTQEGPRVLRIASPRRRTTNAEQPTPNNQRRTTNAERPTPNDQRRTADAEPPTANDQRRTTNAERPTPNDQRRTTKDQTPSKRHVVLA